MPLWRPHRQRRRHPCMPGAGLCSGARGCRDRAATGRCPSEVPQYFLPLRGTTPASPSLVYRPGVLAAATVNFVSSGRGASSSNRIRRIAPAPESALALDWEQATDLEAHPGGPRPTALSRGDLRTHAAGMAKLASYRSWGSTSPLGRSARRRPKCSRAPGSSRPPIQGRARTSSGPAAIGGAREAGRAGQRSSRRVRRQDGHP